jgi:protein ImuA
MSETFELAHGDPRSRLIDELRHRVARWEASAAPDDEVTFSSGTPALDRLLAAGPLRYGMLTEWLSGLARSGAATLSLLCAREACRPGGALVVIDRQQTFYPPAAAAWGVDLKRLLIVRPRGAGDELWAAEQALRSPAVAALWATIDRLDTHAFRRLQLAAQAGHTLGLLLRPACARAQPSWADVRLEVSNFGVRISDCGFSRSIRTPGYPLGAEIRNRMARRVQVRVLRLRGARPGGSVTLEIDDAADIVREVTYDTLPLPVVAQLADPAARSLSARA